VVKTAALTVSLIVLWGGIMLSGVFAADPIRLGVLLPLTGRDATIGQIQKNAALMAAAEINARGGIKGRKIEPVLADTEGTPDGGRTAIQTLIQTDKVLVISGGYSSSATWATSAIAQQRRIPFVVTSAPADKITEQGWEYVFRLNQPLGEHLEALAAFISTTAADIKSVAIVHASSLKSASEARRFFKKAEALGLKMVIKENFTSGAADFRPLLTRVKTKNPDLLYTVTDEVRDAALLTRHSRELNLNPKLFVGGTAGFALPEFAEKAGIASNHVVCTTQWTTSVPYPGAKEYHAKFKARYHTPPTYHGAQAYAAVYVMADALRRTKALTPGNVREALAKTNMKTIYGPVKFISYNKKSRQNRLPTLLVQWIDGKAEIVWPQHLATKKAIYPAHR